MNNRSAWDRDGKTAIFVNFKSHNIMQNSIAF